MDNSLTVVNAAIIIGLLGVTWWYALSTSRLLRQAQDQVAEMQSQAATKIEELQLSYTQILKEMEGRRQAEERLDASEARFAAFMRYLPGTATMRDTQGVYLFANEAWEKVFGRTGGEWMGKALEEIWPPDQASRFLELDRQVLAKGQPVESVETWEQDGHINFFLNNQFPIRNQEGQAVMVGAIGIDVSARLHAEEALRTSESKLRSLTAQLLTAQEDERKRLAAELHDELGHALLTLKLKLESLGEQLQPQQVSLKIEVSKILRFIGATIGEVRRLYLDLSPGDLEDLGLTDALNSMIEDFVALQKKIEWEVQIDNLDGLFPLSIQTAIYRVVQEALTNIGKHASPEHVALTIRREDDRVSFVIDDDGKGFDRHKIFAEKKTLGLLSMEERVKILRGDFELFTKEGQGTRIFFTIPLGGRE